MAPLPAPAPWRDLGVHAHHPTARRRSPSAHPSYTVMTTAAPQLTFRTARRDDLEAIVALLADDEIARSRSGYASMVNAEVIAAFAEIERDPNNELIVGEQD